MWLGQYKNILSTYLTLYTLYTHFLELQFFLIMVWECGIAKNVGVLTLPHDITYTHVSGLSYHRSAEECPKTGFFLLWSFFQPQMHVFQLGVPDYCWVASLPFGIFPPDDCRCYWTIKSLSWEWSTFPFLQSTCVWQGLTSQWKKFPVPFHNFSYAFYIAEYCVCLINLLTTKSTHLLNHTFIQYSDLQTKPEY